MTDSAEEFLAHHDDPREPPILSDGQVVGDWRIAAFLGRGGSGEVYRVVETHGAREGRAPARPQAAALKILARNTETARARFLREASLLATMDNPAFPRFLAQGEVDGHRFGFNLGYGFGDTSAASENMLFFDGKAHKLGRVDFGIPKKPDGSDDLLSPWHFTDDEGRLDLVFTPILDRASKTDVLIICSDQHQVFGRFTGSAVLDDGTTVRIGNFLGFAEKVFNKW